ncbi:MAG: peptidoglycan-associated lipoprotein Pal [SAR324 cluster bacterium]|uniref:Peptidoglycan-associated lipoprotein n=1 Tax=SAR324 cluster bacterium TaxID=2024889 RepID=A0A7X9FUR7_9DELT|nr:peptidoglycan-associated lipoprotein Pal [SAR324 cluster bacterium]
MRISKILLVLIAGLVMTGCSCKTKTIEGAENVPGTGISQSPLKDINFDFDKYNITPTAQGILKENAAWLKANPGKKVQIEGHCDERGTSEYNMALGNKRAKAAFDYLKSLGVDPAIMSTVSYGKELPLDPRHNEEAWAKNRRDHFNVQ